MVAALWLCACGKTLADARSNKNIDQDDPKTLPCTNGTDIDVAWPGV